MSLDDAVLSVGGNDMQRSTCPRSSMPGRTPALSVLHVLPSLDPRTGGVAEAVVQLVKHMRQFGCMGDVATLDSPDGAAFDRVCGDVYRLGPGRGFYGLSRKLAHWIRRHADDYDAIIVHGIWQFHSVAARIAVAGKQVPLLVFPHGMLDPWFQRSYPAKHIKKVVYWNLLERWVFRRANAILFTCQAELDLARRPFLSDALPLRVNGFGIEPVPVEIDESMFRDAYPELEGKRVLLFLSRIHEKKGCDLLIRAFARVASQDADLRLVIAGPGDDGLIQRLRIEARSLGVDGQVVWTGMLSGNLKWAALRAAELFVLPSHQENFGIAVVEALASGTPVLTTDRVNIWKEIETSGGGWICPDTTDGVAEALARWMRTTAAERYAMRELALDTFRKHFRVEAAARELTEIITEIRRSVSGKGSMAR